MELRLELNIDIDDVELAANPEWVGQFQRRLFQLINETQGCTCQSIKRMDKVLPPTDKLRMTLGT